MITISQQIHFSNGTSGRKQVLMGSRPPRNVSVRRVSRIAKLMALAIRYDEMLRDGPIRGVGELARLCHVTQPRMTQILNLNYLSPDIQEELLYLSGPKTGRDPIHEKLLRPIAAEIDWQKQRKMWSQIKQRSP